MTSWVGLDRGPITAAIANAEPVSERLFSRPAPRPCVEVQRMLAAAEAEAQRRRRPTTTTRRAAPPAVEQVSF